MITTTAILSIIVFLCAFKFLGLERLGTEILASARSAAGVVRDPNLSDETREKELQRSSIDLFKSFFSILFRGVLCLVLSFVPIWLASLTGLAKMGDVIGFLSRWDVIIIATIIIGAGYVICVRRRPAPSSQPMVENYTFGDRLLHRIAFGAPSMQFVAADIEKSRFNGMYEGVTNPGPIFITSLPRAGTTLMLEVLHRFPNLATHTYRDMPFVMAPILWSRLSGSFKKNAELRERAHGDGMNIGYDSPEAFEEVLWRTFWPEKVHQDTHHAVGWG
ncbi:hypothetical protein D3OALGA1CA_2685 [Olavius algarvensis associated proteobacterium Delta 3]|nr:hypothetical protein D3OALGA1CA_2685 [Olavius algarvensis associated proteobacterium Delta 3]